MNPCVYHLDSLQALRFSFFINIAERVFSFHAENYSSSPAFSDPLPLEKVHLNQGFLFSCCHSPIYQLYMS